MLRNYSVTPISNEHFEERVADIIDQVKSGVTTVPLFMMLLVPEGDPVWDKATDYAKMFRKYKEALAKENVPAGILVQCSLGHGYPKAPTPFQPVVDFKSGEARHVCCPLDKGFLEHFKSELRTLAKEHPAAIMLDDDFRLMVRPGLGCGCPLHMAEFNKKAGLSLTREELWEHVIAHPHDDPLADIFREVQLSSLENCAKEFRSALDEIDPEIQGINCTSGHICECVDRTNKLFAGKNNPTIVRVPNGIYAPRGLRELSETFRNAAICKARLKKRGIDYILAETDTIPFNRYSKSSRFLHAHYLGSLLEGLSGAKHWLTRTSSFEPDSGKAYRKILAEHKGMYEAVSELGQSIRFFGINSLFIEQDRFRFDRPVFNRYHEENWIKKNIERMGLPFYYSEAPEKATFIDDPMTDDMTDGMIKDLFASSTVFMDGESARKLYLRGYGELLGVKSEEWDLGAGGTECFDDKGEFCCTPQKNRKKLTLINEKCTPLSYNAIKVDGAVKLLAPSVTRLERDGGLATVVFCGSPNAEPSYTEGFSFLNETRKKQLVSLIKPTGSFPAYIPGDLEIMLRGGYLENGEMLLYVNLLSIDPEDELIIYLEKEPSAIESMTPSGERETLSFKPLGDNKYSINVRLEAMYPLILFIK